MLPLRLAEKRLQRNIDGSREFLLDADDRCQMNTRDPFYPDRHLEIDNTALGPADVAERIATRFDLPRRSA
jgi:hypothetical protein